MRLRPRGRIEGYADASRATLQAVAERPRYPAGPAARSGRRGYHLRCCPSIVMVELREPLEQLIRSPRQFTAGTTFPRADEIRTYYHNLNNLGLTEDDLVSYALVLGPELE